MSGIDIKNLHFSYDDKCIFKDLNVLFPEGQVSVLMAPSGRGKTTLLHLVAGLKQAQAGNITYPMEDMKCSMVFQEGRLVEQLSVQKNIQLVNSRISAMEIGMCLQELELTDFEKKRVCDLSGGEKQRVAIARALLAEYDVLLLDEPFTGLDDTIKERVIQVIKDRSQGKTVLLVTHDREEAMLMGGHVYEEF